MQSSDQIGVFIAEDSELLQEVLLTSLRPIDGITVSGQAFCGRTAISGIRKNRPDVVLLDLSMPEGDGFEVLRNLSAEAEPPLLIVMTFECDAAVSRLCVDMGAHRVFDKGEHLHLLLDLLQSLAVGECTLADLKRTPSPCTTTRFEIQIP